MRQGSNSKRPRGKGGNRGGSGGARNALTRSYDSNGPAGRVRGNPHQVHEKYLSLARDAQADDPILAENLLQHADHYFRIIAEASGNKPRRDDNRRDDNRRDDQSDQDEDRQETMDDADASAGDNRGNVAAQDDADGQQPQANGAVDGDGQEQAAPKRARRPRRPKAQDAKSDEVASDAA
jgi:hypothetical protein